MGSLDMQEILALNQKYPELSLQQILQFITLVLVQPTHIPASDPPDVLSPLITLFLRNTPLRVILLGTVMQWVFVRGRECYLRFWTPYVLHIQVILA
jgi:hypothetical protein